MGETFCLLNRPPTLQLTDILSIIDHFHELMLEYRISAIATNNNHAFVFIFSQAVIVSFKRLRQSKSILKKINLFCPKRLKDTITFLCFLVLQIVGGTFSFVSICAWQYLKVEALHWHKLL